MKISANRTRLCPDRICAGTRGSYGLVQMEFLFSDEWEGLSKKIVFHPVRGRPVEIPYLGGEIDIPPEVMQHSGEARFVVSGVASSGGEVERKIVSLTGVIEVEHTQDDRGGNSIPVTPDTFDMLIEQAEQKIEDKLTEAKESGEFNGEKGDPFEYSDFTAEQLENLRGPAGDSGVFVSEKASDRPPKNVNVHIATDEDDSEYDVAIIDGWEREGDFVYLLCEDERIGDPIEVFDGKDGVDGRNGVDGKDGVSPVVTTEAITGGTRIAITDAAGTKIVDVTNGVDGRNGSNGRDGVDGNDYVLTDADKADIAALVIEKMQPTTVSITITADSWGETVTITDDAITATNRVEMLPGIGVTAEQLAALQSANCIDIGEQSAGSITFGVMGTVPTIDIPVRFIIGG